MKEQDIPDLNIFMMCNRLNENALSDLPSGYYIRNCRLDELELWMEFPFDTEEDKINYKDFMKNYYNNVYKKQEDDYMIFIKDVCLSVMKTINLLLHALYGKHMVE